MVSLVSVCVISDFNIRILETVSFLYGYHIHHHYFSFNEMSKLTCFENVYTYVHYVHIKWIIVNLFASTRNISNTAGSVG